MNAYDSKGNEQGTAKEDFSGGSNACDKRDNYTGPWMTRAASTTSTTITSAKCARRGSEP